MDPLMTITQVWVEPLYEALGIPFAKNLVTSKLWSTLSNALAKSMNAALTDPPASRVEHHWCSSETKAWLVDLPWRVPNWLGSIVGKIMSRNQRPTMDSKTLARVGNSDIGRRSVSVDLGGLTLGIGITLADFPNCGNVHCIRDWLNMALTGSAGEEANSLRNQFGTKSGPEALVMVIVILSLLYCSS